VGEPNGLEVLSGDDDVIPEAETGQGGGIGKFLPTLRSTLVQDLIVQLNHRHL
jgi:hypothetical protein